MNVVCNLSGKLHVLNHFMMVVTSVATGGAPVTNIPIACLYYLVDLFLIIILLISIVPLICQLSQESCSIVCPHTGCCVKRQYCPVKSVVLEFWLLFICDCLYNRVKRQFCPVKSVVWILGCYSFVTACTIRDQKTLKKKIIIFTKWLD